MLCTAGFFFHSRSVPQQGGHPVGEKRAVLIERKMKQNRNLAAFYAYDAVKASCTTKSDITRAKPQSAPVAA
jgi:hypothetical protein